MPPFRIRVSGLVAVLVLLSSAALAQTFPVTAGEHGAFTRLVVRSTPGLAWTFTATGPQRTLSIAAENPVFDLTRLFDRIPRTRLAAARVVGQSLELSLGCDCDVRAWEERPGLIVLDIANPARGVTPAVRPEIAPVDPLALARAAGATLARARPDAPLSAEAPPPMTLSADERIALTTDLGISVAQALGQGILEPAVDHVAPQGGVLQGAELPQMPENMSVTSVTDRTVTGPTQGVSPDPECQGSEVLDHLLDRGATRFPDAYAAVSQQLYGEFDQPDPEAQHALILLYLASGFGAEARALIDNATQPLPGREFALGFADVLEERLSNSRMRLAGGIDCGGVAALAAALAGADTRPVRQHADHIALTFTRLPESLRALLGLDLVRMLTEAGSVDAARIVAESLRGSAWTVPEDAQFAQALLARSRGNVPEAASRLSALPDDNLIAMLERLELALDNGTPVADLVLEDAEALASASRNDASGQGLMAVVIRLRSASTNPTAAFATLDRLQTWLSETGENQRLLGTLRDEAWASVARNVSDRSLIEAVLARDDWRQPDLLLPTRHLLAERLIDLGFSLPAAELLGGEQDPHSRLLSARVALAMGSPNEALTLVSGLADITARELRASALSRAGDHAAAAEEFARMGEVDGAIRAAILAGNWRLVETLRSQSGEAPQQASLDDLLGRAPGHAETLRSAAPDSDETVQPTAGLQALQPVEPIEPPSLPAPVVDGPPAEAQTPTGALRAADAPVEPLLAAPAAQISPDRDVETLFDRMGMIQRSSTLMAESERLRLAVGALVETRGR